MIQMESMSPLWGLSILSLSSRCETPCTNSDLLNLYQPWGQWCSVLSSQAHTTCSKYYIWLVKDSTALTYSAHVCASLSHQTSPTKHKIKYEIIKNFKTATTEHKSTTRPLWMQGPVQLHRLPLWSHPGTQPCPYLQRGPKSALGSKAWTQGCS